MKKLILIISAIGLLTLAASAQQRRKTNSTRQMKLASSRTVQNATRLSATDNYAAKSNAGSMYVGNHYSIADPTVQALSARAGGSDVKMGKSGIVGMPKRAYGFANGHLTFYSTGATSSGTITGTGLTGTGSSLGSIGSEGPAIGLNGKSPYAGSTMWGNAMGIQPGHIDSGVRVPRRKNN